MLGSTSGFMKRARKQLFPGTEYEKYSKQIIDLINVKFISDSIIFTLPLDDIGFSHEHYAEKETKHHCIIMFLNFISMFCTLFISHTGCCVRGGISIGKHYEKYFNEEQSLFVFSQAYVNAYRLEQEAKMPRILLDKVFYDYLIAIDFPKIEGFFFDDPQDESRWVCFDFYRHLLTEPDKARKVFKDIKNGIMLNLKQNGGDVKIRSKLEYFANYHNEKVTSINLDSRDTIIEIP